MGYLATEIIVLLAGAAAFGLIIGWALFGLGRKKAEALAPASPKNDKAEADFKAERDARKKAEMRILELEARETNFGERLQERDTKIAELMHQLDEQARFRVQSAAEHQEREQKIVSLESELAARVAEVPAPLAALVEAEPNPELELKDAEIARLSEELETLTAGLEQLKGQDTQHTARIAQLDRENAELRATLVTTANAAPTTSEEKDQIIARLNEEVTGLRAAYEAAEQALEEQDAAIDKLTRDLLATQKKLNQTAPEPPKAGPTRGGAAAKPAAPVAPVAPPLPVAKAPPLPGALDTSESTVAISLDALVSQIDKAATPPPVPPPVPAPAKTPAPVEASESTVAISLDALVAQIDAKPAIAPPPVPPVPAPAVKAPAPAEANESTVAISLDALVAQIDSKPAAAVLANKPVAPAPVDLSESTVAISLDALVAQIDSKPAPIAPPPVAQPKAPPALDLSESTLAISLDALVAQIDSAPKTTSAPKAPPAPEPNESTVAISLEALVAQIESGAPKAPPKATELEVNESTVAISLADLVSAVDEGEVIDLKLDVPPAAPGHNDDLQRIRGIGSNTAKRLNSAGIRTWGQMAQLSEKDLGQVADLLKISLEKIKREQWVEQARALTGS